MIYLSRALNVSKYVEKLCICFHEIYIMVNLPFLYCDPSTLMVINREKEKLL